MIIDLDRKKFYPFTSRPSISVVPIGNPGKNIPSLPEVKTFKLSDGV